MCLSLICLISEDECGCGGSDDCDFCDCMSFGQGPDPLGEDYNASMIESQFLKQEDGSQDNQGASLWEELAVPENRRFKETEDSKVEIWRQKDTDVYWVEKGEIVDDGERWEYFFQKE